MDAVKSGEEIIWRNMNLPIMLHAASARLVVTKQSGNLSPLSYIRQSLNARSPAVWEDRDQFAEVSPEVLDMRFSASEKSQQNKSIANFKRQLESFLWHPDALTSQTEGSFSVQLMSDTEAPSRVSKSAMVQKWFQNKQEVDRIENYWSAYDAFIGFDANQSGYLEIDEIYRLAECLWEVFNPNISCSEEECDDLVDGLLLKLDQNGNECIPFESFLPWYDSLQYSMKDYAHNAAGRLSAVRRTRSQDVKLLYALTSTEIDDPEYYGKVISREGLDIFYFDSIKVSRL